MCFDPVANICVIAMGQRIYLYDNFSGEFAIYLLFLRIVSFDKMYYFHEKIYFSSNGCHGNKTKIIYQLSEQRLLR